jgi:hypothetical protein
LAVYLTSIRIWAGLAGRNAVLSVDSTRNAQFKNQRERGGGNWINLVMVWASSARLNF